MHFHDQTGACDHDRASERQFIAIPSLVWWTKQTRSAAGVLRAKLLALLEAYNQRRAAEILYTKLSRLSEAELERRGIARGDLGRLISETTGSD